MPSTGKSTPSQSAINGSGASATLSELSKNWDEDLESLEFRCLKESQKERQEKLKEQTERFVNSSIPDGLFGPWECTKSTAALVHMAAICSKAVYQKELPCLPNYSVDISLSIEASAIGSVKETTVYLINNNRSSGAAPSIVIAVRGSKGFFDWVVNTNCDMEDASDIIDMMVLNHVSCTTAGSTSLLAHSGLLNAAKILVSKLVGDISSLLAMLPKNVRVIFTGHSAGGAVAQILYAHFLTYSFTKYDFLDVSTTELSVITFGSPPIFSCPLTPILQSIPSGLRGSGVCLAIAICGDPLVRMDAAYGRVLLGQYASANALEVGQSGLAPRPTNKLSTPEQKWYRIGEVAVFRQPDNDEGIKADAMAESDLYAFFFGNFIVHAMAVYLDVAEQIMKGRFNGRSGWKR
ncbi:alpha/beta-hydrolase [Wilcoxina mikolae CBS 423.85]|nr:alpha/beta-hydrolase [Wilcoxina mikolae CBS 423.85]